MDITKPNLDKFNDAEITYQTDFKVPINKTMIKGNNKNNTFKILLNENYNYFITSLKKNITHLNLIIIKDIIKPFQKNI